jgi:hypothetical protein
MKSNISGKILIKTVIDETRYKWYNKSEELKERRRSYG